MLLSTTEVTMDQDGLPFSGMLITPSFVEVNQLCVCLFETKIGDRYTCMERHAAKGGSEHKNYH
jgi:hypothetical protein